MDNTVFTENDAGSDSNTTTKSKAMTRGTRFFPYSGPIVMVNERRGVALLNSVSMTQWFSAHVFVDARVKPALVQVSSRVIWLWRRREIGRLAGQHGPLNWGLPKWPRRCGQQEITRQIGGMLTPKEWLDSEPCNTRLLGCPFCLF